EDIRVVLPRPPARWMGSLLVPSVGMILLPLNGILEEGHRLRVIRFLVKVAKLPEDAVDDKLGLVLGCFRVQIQQPGLDPFANRDQVIILYLLDDPVE